MRRGLRQLLFWAPPVATMAVVSVSLSISVPLFALLLKRAGASATEIGLNHTVAAVAMIVAAFALPRVLSHVGLVPLMLGSIAMLALSTIAIPLWESAWWWAFLRIGWGLAGTALFFASEFWLISVTPEATRGRIVGLYVLILSGSYMVGPLLLNLLGIDSWLTFVVPTLIILASAVPVVLGHRDAPPARSEERPAPLRLLRFFRTDPSVLWGVMLFGIIEFGAMGLVTVWGLDSGHDQATSVNFVFWLAFGSMAFQLPVGWAADRFDRLKLLALAAAVSAAMPVAVAFHSGSVAAVSFFAFLWGGMAVSFYSLALTELGARYRGGVLAEANAAVVLAYGFGALAGPAAFGTAMDIVRPDGLLWLAAAVSGGYFALTSWRMARKSREPLDSRPQNGT